MILYREISWWYGAVTSVLLIAGVAGRFEAFYLAIALSAIQVVHFRMSHGGAHPVAYAMEPARTPLGRFVAENFSLSAG